MSLVKVKKDKPIQYHFLERIQHKDKLYDDMNDAFTSSEIQSGKWNVLKCYDGIRHYKVTILQVKRKRYIMIEKDEKEHDILDSQLVMQYDSTKAHKDVSICFADIKSFTKICSTMKPVQVRDFLRTLFKRFDLLCKKYNIHKIETIGDCYLSVAGLVDDYNPQENANNMFTCAKEMIKEAYVLKVEIRIGIHTGSVISGVIDEDMPRSCLFGDAVNVASRMESLGMPMHIHVSEDTYMLLRDKSNFVERNVDVKGKGIMKTYMYKYNF